MGVKCLCIFEIFGVRGNDMMMMHDLELRFTLIMN